MTLIVYSGAPLWAGGGRRGRSLPRRHTGRAFGSRRRLRFHDSRHAALGCHARSRRAADKMHRREAITRAAILQMSLADDGFHAPVLVCQGAY